MHTMSGRQERHPLPGVRGDVWNHGWQHGPLPPMPPHAMMAPLSRHPPLLLPYTQRYAVPWSARAGQRAICNQGHTEPVTWGTAAGTLRQVSFHPVHPAPTHGGHAAGRGVCGGQRDAQDGTAGATAQTQCTAAREASSRCALPLGCLHLLEAHGTLCRSPVLQHAMG